MSIRLSGKAYRWHDPDHIHHGKNFYRTFEDGPWKWDAQGRFAGKGINCGHFFGLSVEAATAEAEYYDMHPDRRTLLEIEASSTRILDLTDRRNMQCVFKKCIQNHEIASSTYFEMLVEMVEKQKGGNVFTDYIGWWAKHAGYDGILFFSARAVQKYRSQFEKMNTNLGYDHAPEVFYFMRRDASIRNVVIFSGADLVNAISKYSVNGTPHTNPLYGNSRDFILGLSGKHGEDYQVEKNRSSMIRPGYNLKERTNSARLDPTND
jgi:hypothetical protein